ncbi:endonuclease/exonuclease/phosphatase family protein [Patulibacter defluvii]|uniref:endonuclease/exonuclease/phosphatase family protein n=1 Tax=Patulibacter defluvii TaxID=3095358 RepID=UPI002A761700|nr:endonuclease/exonuclease/phosphatase family protein [Patulibacter sp. DM4]
MRVLSWNLFHGRATPAAGRPLLHEFAVALRDWSWDVALLQEVPPWWPPLLARATGAEQRSARTSRNQCLPLRRAVARRRPDWLKSNGGGANAILVRGGLLVTGEHAAVLRRRPERRVVHAVRIGVPGGGPFEGAWLGNVHTQLGAWDDHGGMDAPAADLDRSLDALRGWAGPGDGVLLLGGDLNLPAAAVQERLPAGWQRVCSHGPDHLLARGARPERRGGTLERGALSDHAPIAVDLRPG